MASMEEAAKIRDVAARHAYVFDNGLSSPDFFDVEKRMASEEFGLIKERCDGADNICEVGCFTGLNLLCLAELGKENLHGLDFVKGAVEWLLDEAGARRFRRKIHARSGTFGSGMDEDRCTLSYSDLFICFDVLEHQPNVGRFLSDVSYSLNQNGKALFLVPKGKNYNDCGHLAWFPDEECLTNVLDYHFSVEECFELKTCQKLFACCKRRD